MNHTDAPLLRLRGIHHRFGMTDVLRQVDLDLAAGETLALVGPSGCGKSTLLSIAAGLRTPSEGTVQNHFRCVGHVFQQPRLLPWKTARDNVALGLKARGMPGAKRREIADALLHRLGLQPLDADKYPHKLSGGMQSRVALARALAITPDLLLLDEAFSALDVGLRLELYQLLRNEVAQRGCAVLMITHDLMEAVRLADRVVVMHGSPGRISHSFGVPTPTAARTDAWVYRQMGQLMADPRLRSAFELPEVVA